MPTSRSLAGSLVCWFSFAVFCAAAAQGQAQRTFVSTSGSDANTALLCSSANPCRSFGAALTVTNPAGEVIALSSGGYGPFTVTQPVSIISPAGVYVGVSVFTGDGVTIDAPGATVILRGLNINAQGTSGSGIQVDDVGSLHVESCVINGFSADTTAHGIQHLSSGALSVKGSILRNNYRGIFVQAPASTIADFVIDDTHVQNNGEVGIFVIRGAGTITRSMASRSSHGVVISAESEAAISDSTATRNGVGIVAQSGGRLTVRNSTVSQNTTGFLGASAAELNVESCSSSGNQSGIFSTSAGTVVRVSNSVVTNNDIGFNHIGGVLETRENNTLRGNTTPTSGTITPIGGG